MAKASSLPGLAWYILGCTVGGAWFLLRYWPWLDYGYCYLACTGTILIAYHVIVREWPYRHARSNLYFVSLIAVILGLAGLSVGFFFHAITTAGYKYLEHLSLETIATGCIMLIIAWVLGRFCPENRIRPHDSEAYSSPS